MSVLCGLAGLDVNELNLAFFTPSQEMATRKFRPVVAPDTVWNAATFHDLLERARDALAREPCVYFQGQAFASESIDNRQHPNPSTRRQCIRSKVQCPFLIGSMQVRQQGDWPAQTLSP